jgi:hypothetical protein
LDKKVLPTSRVFLSEHRNMEKRCLKLKQHAESVFDDSTTIMFKKVEKKNAICIICISLTDFPEPPEGLASMFYHFQPDNNTFFN